MKNDYHGKVGIVEKFEKGYNRVLMYDESHKIPDCILHYVRGLGIKPVAGTFIGFDENHNPKYLASFYRNGEKLRTICNTSYGPVKYTIVIEEDHFNNKYESLELSDDGQVDFKTRNERPEWCTRVLDREYRLHIGLWIRGIIKHIDITSDKFGNIIIMLNDDAEDRYKDTGNKFVILTGQEKHTPKEYIDKLIDSIEHSKDNKLFELVLRDPRVEERIQSLLDKMPKSLEEAYSNLKREIDIDYFNKLDILAKERIGFEVMGSIAKDELGMYDDTKHTSIGIGP